MKGRGTGPGGMWYHVWRSYRKVRKSGSVIRAMIERMGWAVAVEGRNVLSAMVKGIVYRGNEETMVKLRKHDLFLSLQFLSNMEMADPCTGNR